MQRIISVLVVLATPVLLDAGIGDDVRKELKALQGTWKAVALEAGGMPLPKEAIPAFTYTIGADGKATGKMAKSEYTATMTVNPNADPKTIDNVHESGAQKGKKQYGVFKLEGDKLTVCMTPPGAAVSDRPKDFTTKDTTNVVFVFERVKEDGKKPELEARLEPFRGKWTSSRERKDDENVGRYQLLLEFKGGELSFVTEEGGKKGNQFTLKVIGVEKGDGAPRLILGFSEKVKYVIHYDLEGDHLILLGRLPNRPFEGFSLSGEYKRVEKPK